MVEHSMKRVPGLTVVVPVYNSELSLRPLLERLLPVLPRVAERYEVILVNDGSRDQSWQVAKELAAAHACVRGINMRRNFGQHNALLCGLRAASHALTVTMDDDLQHPPEELPRMLHALEKESADVVYGAPKRQPHGLLRGLASEITKIALQQAMGARTARHISAFRLLRTDVCEAFASYNSPLVNLDVLLTWGTTRFAVCFVRHDERKLGQSNYTVWKLLRHALNMITGFSIWPLRVASLLGFLFTALGGLLLLFVVGRYVLEGTTVAGFPFLASSISLFSGAQLFALGIIGEYLALTHFRSMGRPVYAVREDTMKP